LKFINFSRLHHSPAVHLGCHWPSGYLDITQAITDGLLPFPQVAHTLEDVLHLDNGLSSLEKALETLGDSGVEVKTILLSEANVTLKSPVLNPQKIIGIGLNYRDHAEEFKLQIPKAPILFGMFANAIIGPEAPIVIPPGVNQVDYEAELAVVIGTRARRVSEAEAVNYVAGYSIFHDVSAREMQFGDKQWTRGKTIDTFAPMGPCLVTRSELGDAGNLAIELRLNGERLQKSNTRNLIFNVAALVSIISQTMTLEPGDVIATGTPSGVGYVRNPPIFLKPGDAVEIEIEGIGVLRNPVAGSD
jgi:2-keto-4-pentenoate hydratase/2-oxohepta-3-ene-1,7-dioic acid hydratase in catechol pathway